jgi:glycerophosphoryl diester phosphodiesterase
MSAFLSCEKKYDAPVPDTRWELFESPEAMPMNNTSRKAMNGVYDAVDGFGMFGSNAAIRWSYVCNGTDTVHHLSIFMPEDITYMICEGKRIDSLFIFNGYWRKILSTKTGIVRFTVDPAKGGRLLFQTQPVVAEGDIELEGVFGEGDQYPGNRLVLRYDRPLNADTSFLIMAHRCGGRSADMLPASENSVEMLRLAASLGATGIEMDVRLTSDGVPVIYHDEDLNDRLTLDIGMTGPIRNYSYEQLNGLVRLIHGEKIPLLTEALTTIVYETDLRFVWLDIKFDGPLDLVRSIADQYTNAARAIGRDVQIVIGIPDDDVFGNFTALPGYSSVPSLCELEISKVREANSIVWASRWTSGLVTSDVAAMHSEGRKVFAWTIDVPQYIQQFVDEGRFDAVLTNYPSALAYYHYVH